MKQAWEAMNRPGGDWVNLYSRAEGYVSTEFYVDTHEPLRCVTIDTWRTRRDWAKFKEQYGPQFDELAARSRELFEGPDDFLADIDYSSSK